MNSKQSKILGLAFTDIGLGPELLGTGICLFLVTSFYFLFLVTNAGLSWPSPSAFQTMLNSHGIISYIKY